MLSGVGSSKDTVVPAAERKIVFNGVDSLFSFHKENSACARGGCRPDDEARLSLARGRRRGTAVVECGQSRCKHVPKTRGIYEDVLELHQVCIPLIFILFRPC